MIVEIFGPSCAGKTTLADRIAEYYGRHGMPAQRVHGRRGRRPRTLRADFLRGVAHPRMLLWLLADPRFAVTERGRLIVRATGLVRRLQDQPGVHLVDEGPLRIASAVDLGHPQLLIKALHAPDAAVLVHCDPVVRLQRIRAEARRGAEQRSDAEIIDREERQVQACKMLAGALAAPVIEVDTTDGIDRADEVIAQLDRLRCADPGHLPDPRS